MPKDVPKFLKRSIGQLTILYSLDQGHFAELKFCDVLLKLVRTCLGYKFGYHGAPDDDLRIFEEYDATLKTLRAQWGKAMGLYRRHDSRHMWLDATVQSSAINEALCDIVSEEDLIELDDSMFRIDGLNANIGERAESGMLLPER